MSVPNTRLANGQQFYWDGRAYASRDEAVTARAEYERNGFETCAADDDATFLVYTRRVVRHVGNASAN